MSLLPVGTVTFLFTDVEGSAKLWESYGDAMRIALARHDALLRERIETRGGTVFKTLGDAFCAAFPTAPEALAAAIDAQIALAQEPWPDPIRLRVRVALHAGAVEGRDDDYFGPPLNRVARLLATAHGGQTLLSQTAYDLVRDALPPEVTLHDLGEHRLKDLARPERVFQVLHASLPREFPPLRSLDSAALPNNLPQQVTSFIGRERELATIQESLARARLLTLTGAGGSGKSRLALQVAAEALDGFPDGAFLVELAPLAGPSLVASTVASVLGAKEESGKPVLATLTDHLKSKRLLLLLDNCEHVLDASAGLADALMRSCPGVKVLATSREALGISGETTYRVPSLSLPDPKRPQTPESLSHFEAVQLFIERAVQTSPAFVVTNENAPALASVCFRLDGIPLAIELAAARIRSLSIEDIDAKLDGRFRLLTGGSRTALPRQQTLRSLIDWSYDLLSSPERALLRRLSVFAGGWTLAAVEAVGAGDEVESWAVLEGLTSLCDKSLAVAEPSGTTMRYRLLETVRQYARERLAETDESDAVRGRSKDYFLGLAEDADPRLMQEEGPVWFRNLQAEHDNLRAALEWCLDPNNPAEDGAAGLRLCAALDNFWYLGSHVREARASLQSALARTTGERTRERTAALRRYGFFTNYQGDPDAARSPLREALAIATELGDASGAGRALKDLAWIAGQQRDWPEGRRLLEESRERFEESGDAFGLSQAVHELGILAEYQGEFSRAQALYEEALRMFRELGNHERAVWTLHGLGYLALRREDFAEAGRMLRESLRLFCDLDDGPGKIRSLERLASLALAQGREARAVRLLGAVAAAREAIGAPPPPSEREEGEQILEAARSALGGPAFGEAWADGQTTPLRQAVEDALADGNEGKEP